jgi:hypothetical protein
MVSSIRCGAAGRGEWPLFRLGQGGRQRLRRHHGITIVQVPRRYDRAGTAPGSEILATCSAIGSVDNGCISAE